MKDIKGTLIKLTISIIILGLAFKYLERKPQVNAIQFDMKPVDNTPPMPLKLQWHDPFKGVNNLQSKPKPVQKED